MSNILNDIDLQQLATLYAAAKTLPTGSKEYWRIYQLLADKLVSDYNYDWKDPTVLWLRGATQANKGDGAFSDLIRGYTNTQYQLRYKEVLSDEKMQEASNQVAESLIRDLLREGEYIRGTVVQIAQLLGLTGNYGTQTMTDVAIMGQTFWNYLSSPKTAKDLWNAVTDGASNPPAHAKASILLRLARMEAGEFCSA